MISCTLQTAFFVSLDYVFLKAGTTNRRILQGSILGLLLFSEYIDCIPLFLLNSQKYLYADDMRIFINIRTLRKSTMV